jgi:hypothetical protein
VVLLLLLLVMPAEHWMRPCGRVERVLNESMRPLWVPLEQGARVCCNWLGCSI